mmetsp:Transcript_31202/g.87097  ORF Transcript_31202/g.87097 Transcript_31202/m.87097 type:complete len:258 (+) Transcript_31202:212-985(+)
MVAGEGVEDVHADRPVRPRREVGRAVGEVAQDLQQHSERRAQPATPRGRLPTVGDPGQGGQRGAGAGWRRGLQEGVEQRTALFSGQGRLERRRPQAHRRSRCGEGGRVRLALAGHRRGGGQKTLGRGQLRRRRSPAALVDADEGAGRHRRWRRREPAQRLLGVEAQGGRSPSEAAAAAGRPLRRHRHIADEEAEGGDHACARRLSDAAALRAPRRPPRRAAAVAAAPQPGAPRLLAAIAAGRARLRRRRLRARRRRW